MSATEESKMETRRFYVITGGTMVHVAPHFSLCAPAYGSVGMQIYNGLKKAFAARWETSPVTWKYEDAAAAGAAPQVVYVRTSMAGGNEPAIVDGLLKPAGINRLETNEDLEKLIDYLILQPETKGIILAAAVCDWQPTAAMNYLDENSESWGERKFGKKAKRLTTNGGDATLELHMKPADKIIGTIRQHRKDIFLVGFKATTGMSEQEQYLKGLGLLKGASCNLVLANDVHEHRNMVITPEEAKYHVTKDRKAAIKGLCEMIAMRSQLHFTRSTVVEGDAIPWDGDAIPPNLRKVVDHLIARGAYKPFQGKTVGHFATRGPRDGVISTSRRKSNFNNLADDGLLRIDTVGGDQVIAYGAKPSVGGQSQRIIFDQHPDVDCIVHAHVPFLPTESEDEQEAQMLAVRDSNVPVREQRPYECGSHECGQNTSDGLSQVIGGKRDGIKAVMLDEHGPNICFSRNTDPEMVIEFIERHWDLEAKTGGPVSLESPA